MEEKKKGRRFVKEKSLRINLTIDKNNMDLIDLCCANRNMNVSELFRTFAKEYASNVLKIDLNEFYFNKKLQTKSTIEKEKNINNVYQYKKNELTEEQEKEELERLKAARRLRNLEGDNNA